MKKGVSGKTTIMVVGGRITGKWITVGFTVTVNKGTTNNFRKNSHLRAGATLDGSVRCSSLAVQRDENEMEHEKLIQV
jgi:hypothetical protein